MLKSTKLTIISDFPQSVPNTPVSGYVFLASGAFSIDGGAIPGHINLYSGNGQFWKSYEAGIYPRRIAFLYDVVQY